MVQIHRFLKTRFQLILNRRKKQRFLEIGPGKTRINGFETLDIASNRHADYYWDASRRLPFEKDTFDLLYASHVLEHIAWYQTEKVLNDWVRVLKRGGVIEIWVPDGLKILKALLDYELYRDNYIHLDGWYRYNSERDPYKWAAGRIFTYGDGTGRIDHPNWHRALFTPIYLKKLFENSGLREIRYLDQSEIRGDDHGWINLGMSGVK